MKKFNWIIFFILLDCSNHPVKISKTRSFNKLSMNQSSSKNLITAVTKDTIISTLPVLNSSKSLASGGKIANASENSTTSTLGASGSESVSKNQDLLILDSLDIVASIDVEDSLKNHFDPYFPKFVVKIGDNSSYNLTNNPIHIKVFDDSLCESNKLAEFNFSLNNKIATFQPNYSIIPTRTKYEFSLLSGTSCLPITFLWPDNFVMAKPKTIVIISPSDKQLIGYNDKILILCDKKNNSVKISSESFEGKEFDFACVETGTFQFNYPWKDSVDKSTLLNIKIFNDTKSQISETNLSVEVDFTNPKATIVSLTEAQYISDFPLSYKILFSKPIALSSFDVTDDIGIVSIDECLAENILVSSKESFVVGYVDEIIFQIKNLSNDCVFHPIIKENSVVDAYGNYLLKMSIEPDDKTFIKDSPESPIVKILDPIVVSSTQSNPVISAYYNSSATFKNYQKITLHFASDCSDSDRGQIASSVIYPAKNVLFDLKSPLVTDGSYSFFVRITDPLGRATCSNQIVGYNFYTLDPNDLSLKNNNTSSYNINSSGVYQTNNALISFDMKTKNDFKNYSSIFIFASKNSVLGSAEDPVAKICLDKDGCADDSNLLSGTFKDDSTLNFNLNLEKYDQFKNVPLYFFAKGINLDGETVVSLPENPLNIDTIIPDSNFSVVFSNGQNYLRSNSLFQKIKINSLTSKSFELGSDVKFLLNSCDEKLGKLWLEKILTSTDLSALSSNNYLIFSIAPSLFSNEFKNREVRVFTKITDLAGNSVCDGSNYITFYFDDTLPSDPYLSVNDVTTFYTKETSISIDVKTQNPDQKFNTSDLIQFYTAADCNDSYSVSDWLTMPNISSASNSVTLDLNFALEGSYNLFAKTKNIAGNVGNCSGPFNLIIKKIAEPLPVIALKSFDSYSAFDAAGLSYPNKISISASPASGHTFQVGDSYAFLKSCDTPFPNTGTVGVFISSDAINLVKSGLTANLNDTFVFVIKDKAGNISCSNTLSIVSNGLSNFALDTSSPVSGQVNDFSSSLTLLSGTSSNYIGTKSSLSLVLKPLAGQSFSAGSSYFIGNSCSDSWPATSDAGLQTITATSTASLPINITVKASNYYKLVDYFVIMKNSSGVQSCQKILNYAYNYDVTAPLVTDLKSTWGSAGKTLPTLTGSVTENGTGLLSLAVYSDISCSSLVSGAAVFSATNPYSFSYAITMLEEKQYTFYVKATDVAGNSSCSGMSYVYYYDKTPPTLNLGGITGYVFAYASAFNFSFLTVPASGAAPKGTPIYNPPNNNVLAGLDIQGQDTGSGVDTIEFLKNCEAAKYTHSSPIGVKSTYSLVLVDHSSTNYVVIKITDKAGNVTFSGSNCGSATLSLMYNSTPPTVSFADGIASSSGTSSSFKVDYAVTAASAPVANLRSVNVYSNDNCTGTPLKGVLGGSTYPLSFLNSGADASSTKAGLSASFTIPSPVGGTPYKYSFQALDYNDHVSCSTFTYTYALPPSVTLSASSSAGNTPPSINVTANIFLPATSVKSIAAFTDINCGTVAVGNWLGSDLSYTFKPTSPVNGINNYYFKVIDNKDRELACSSGVLGNNYAFTYDSIAPIINNIASSVVGATGSTLPTFTVTSVEIGSGVKTLDMYTDSSCSSDKAITGITAVVPSSSTVATFQPTSLLDGVYTFYFTATDNLGNKSLCSSMGYSYNYDKTAPVVTFVTSNSPKLNAGNIVPTLTGQITESISGISALTVHTDINCTPSALVPSAGTPSWDAANPHSFSYVISPTALPLEKNYTFYFKVIDNAGNSSCSGVYSTPLSYAYYYDITPPTVDAGGLATKNRFAFKSPFVVGFSIAFPGASPTGAIIYNTSEKNSMTGVDIQGQDTGSGVSSIVLMGMCPPLVDPIPPAILSYLLPSTTKTNKDWSLADHNSNWLVIQITDKAGNIRYQSGATCSMTQVVMYNSPPPSVNFIDGGSSSGSSNLFTVSYGVSGYTGGGAVPNLRSINVYSGASCTGTALTGALGATTYPVVASGLSMTGLSASFTILSPVRGTAYKYSFQALDYSDHVSCSTYTYTFN